MRRTAQRPEHAPPPTHPANRPSPVLGLAEPRLRLVSSTRPDNDQFGMPVDEAQNQTGVASRDEPSIARLVHLGLDAVRPATETSPTNLDQVGGNLASTKVRHLSTWRVS